MVQAPWTGGVSKVFASKHQTDNLHAQRFRGLLNDCQFGSGLPPRFAAGWEQCVSRSKGVSYFFNRVTGESRSHALPRLNSVGGMLLSSVLVQLRNGTCCVLTSCGKRLRTEGSKQTGEPAGGRFRVLSIGFRSEDKFLRNVSRRQLAPVASLSATGE